MSSTPPLRTPAVYCKASHVWNSFTEDWSQLLKERYRPILELGTGTFAVVFSAWDVVHNSFVAIKFIRKQNIYDVLDGTETSSSNSGKPLKRYFREAIIWRHLSKLQCPYIVTCYRAKLRHRHPFFVIEQKQQTLASWIKRYSRLFQQIPRAEIRRAIRQILIALQHIHASRVMHRDLTVLNVLVSETKEKGVQLAISDYGTACLIPGPEKGEEEGAETTTAAKEKKSERTKEMVFSQNKNQRMLAMEDSNASLDLLRTVDALTTKVTAAAYRSPEVILRKKYNEKIDMWAAGILMAEMLLQRHLWQHSRKRQENGWSEMGQMEEIYRLLGTPDRPLFFEQHYDRFGVYYLKTFPEMSAADWNRKFGIDAVGGDLLRGLLQFDPSKRLSAQEALSHPWF